MENTKTVYQKTFINGNPEEVDTLANDFRNKKDIRPLATHTGLSAGNHGYLFFTTIFYTFKGKE